MAQEFTARDFKVGQFLRLNKTKVKIVEIKYPYAVVEMLSISKTLGRYPKHAINITGFTENDIIDPETLQSEEALARAELDDLLN